MSFAIISKQFPNSSFSTLDHQRIQSSNSNFPVKSDVPNVQFFDALCALSPVKGATLGVEDDVTLVFELPLYDEQSYLATPSKFAQS